MELHERIRAARHKSGKTLEQVGEALGITAQAVQQWEKPKAEGGTRPGIKRIVDLADVLGLSLDAILRGDSLDLRAPAAFDKSRHAPLINRIAAGRWNNVVTPDALPPETPFIELNVKPAGYAIALEIDGESMLPEYRPHDIIVIDTGLPPSPGDCVVAVLESEDEATFKVFRPRGRDPRGQMIVDLAPLNPDYPTLTLSADTPGRIVGTLIEHRRYRRRATASWA